MKKDKKIASSKIMLEKKKIKVDKNIFLSSFKNQEQQLKNANLSRAQEEQQQQ